MSLSGMLSICLKIQRQRKQMNIVPRHPLRVPARMSSQKTRPHHPPMYIHPNQLHESAERVNLMCGFYGPNHPECKKAIDDDAELYLSFMKQFQVDDDDVSEEK